MAIIGVGTDLVDISRISSSLDKYGDRFARRILSDLEYSHFRAASRPDVYLAKCFALKEAVSKALGTGIGGGVSWHSIECDRHDNGQPFVRLSHGAAAHIQTRSASNVHVSLTDEAGFVSAFAVLE